jgi:putative N6-adenine-specific DNA methylase
MAAMRLVATAAFGLEAVVKRELEELGLEPILVENGKVTFMGGYPEMVKANLWLRTADRVLLEMGSFPATTFDELFEGVRALPWEEWIHEKGIFPVDGKSVKSTLFSISDCQRISKKAIADRLGEVYGQEWLEETESLYRIQVSLLKDIATLTIDTSGAGLHKRGYRDYNAIAPLKETLAAAMVKLSYWDKDRPLVDPFCGSGTILIEAALMGMNMAPGLSREFAFETWSNFPKEIYKEMRDEAVDATDWDAKLNIVGSDRDLNALKLAERHIERAGVDDQVKLVHADFMKMPFNNDYGVIICNPPYGERMGELEEVEKMYRDMGDKFRTLPTWSKYIITSHRGFERLARQQADRKRKLYNGRIQCNYYQYYGPRPPKGEKHE